MNFTNDEVSKSIRELKERVGLLEIQYQELLTAIRRPITSAPSKPREGQLAFADGTSWNPGKGRGLYQFVSGAWASLHG